MMAAAAPESPSTHTAPPPLLTAARSPIRDYEEEESLPSVGEESFWMENLSTSKNLSSQKFLQMQSAKNHGSQKLLQVQSAKNQRPQKLVQVQSAKKKVFKSTKRKMAVATIEDEAISPANNRHVQSVSRKMAVTTVEDEENSPVVQSLSRKMVVASMSRRAISKKVIDRAVSVSRAVARKRNEQTINSEDATLNPENVMHALIQSCFKSFNFVCFSSCH
ncbi:unnamed protein product [Urochloa humidicola]